MLSSDHTPGQVPHHGGVFVLPDHSCQPEALHVHMFVYFVYVCVYMCVYVCMCVCVCYGSE